MTAAPGGRDGGPGPTHAAPVAAPAYVPGSTQAAPAPGAYVPGSTQAAPAPGAYVPGSTQAVQPPGGAAALGTPGRRIGPYVVERELGRGGMGVVLVVRHPSIPRPLAMKVILGDADPQALHRFGQEAQVMARVRHPNVVVVHELGRAPEGPYLVSELVEGTGLDRRLREGPLEPRQAATLARALADGLAACHAAGVVHRDLKPANVVMRPDGAPVLLDFGIARDQTAERMTRTGQLMGTPAYMAPEQAEGAKALDSRVDVYGLGAILFECLCCRPPFPQHDPPMVIVGKVLLEEPVWPRATHPDVPRSLEELLRVAMAKSPDDRHQGMVAFRADLDRWLRGEATWASTRVPREPRGRAVAAALGGLAALGLAAAGVAAARRPPPADRPTPSSAATTQSAATTAATTVAAAAPPAPSWRAWKTPRERVIAAGRERRRTGAAPEPDALALSRSFFLEIPGPVDMLRLEQPMRVRTSDPTCRTRVLVGPRGQVALVRADGRVGVWDDLRAVLGKPIVGDEYPQTWPDHEAWLIEPPELPTSRWAAAAWSAGELVLGDAGLSRFSPGLRLLSPRPRPSTEASIVRLLLDVPGAGLLVGTGGVTEDAAAGTVTLAGAPLGTHRLGPPRSAAVSADGRWLVTTGGSGGGGTSESTLLAFERGDAGWSLRGEVEFRLGTFDAVAFLPGGSRFVVGTWNGSIELRDAARPTEVLGQFKDPDARFVGMTMGTFAHSAGVHAVLVAGGLVWSGSDGASSDLRCWPIPSPFAMDPYDFTGIKRAVPGGVCSLAALDDDLLLVGDRLGRLHVFVVGPR